MESFKSHRPDIDLPTDISSWDFLFDSAHSCLSTALVGRLRGFTDSVTEQTIQYAELKDLATALSTGLSKTLGLAQGQVVVIYSRNSIWYPVAMLAAVRIGAIASGVSPDYMVDELTHSLTISKAKCLITTADRYEKAVAAASRAGIPQKNVVLLDEPGTQHENKKTMKPKGEATSVVGLVEMGRALPSSAQAPALRITPGMTNASVPAMLCFSSGTTGLPKAVVISHANIIAQCLQIRQITLEEHTKVLAALPFYHITGIVHQMHLPILINASVYVIGNYSMAALCATVSRFEIGELQIVPPILIALARGDHLLPPHNHAGTVMSRVVRRFSSGAAPVSPEVLRVLARRFPNSTFKQGYGLSESTSAIAMHSPEEYGYGNGASAGGLVASTEVRVVDPETGLPCGPGVAGEVWARGPQIALLGYLGDAAATARAFDDDGFLHTGDVGFVDARGLLTITDRIKELIKVKGVGVAPAELENLLLGHPLVSDVAVCGVPDARAGERPKAFVVLREEEKGAVSADEAGGEDLQKVARGLMAYVKAKAARHKRVVEVELVEAIPKSASGKILRRMLVRGAVKKGLVVKEEGDKMPFKL